MNGIFYGQAIEIAELESILGRVALFGTLNPVELTALARALTPTTVSDGDYIYHQVDKTRVRSFALHIGRLIFGTRRARKRRHFLLFFQVLCRRLSRAEILRNQAFL